MEQVTQAGTQLDTMVQRVQGVADMNRQIAAASEQQSSVAEEMNASLEQVKQVVEGSRGGAAGAEDAPNWWNTTARPWTAISRPSSWPDAGCLA